MYDARFNKGGNVKLGGLWSWSTLYSDKFFYVEKLGKSIQGTCGNNCDVCKEKCYVRKSYRYPSVVYSHARNTEMLRNDIQKTFDDLNKQITRARKKPIAIRLNQSGEIENKTQFNMFCGLAFEHPETQFFIYTKNYPVIIERALNGVIPENLTVLISVWHNVGLDEYLILKDFDNIKAFVYDDNKYLYSQFDINTYCMAYDENGKLNHNITCDKCRKCFDRNPKHKIIGCKEH